MGKNNYFIKLKPLNSFYFGSTKSFEKDNPEYFLKSNFYPQQTAVLGMLRKKILEDNNCLVEQRFRNFEQREKEKIFIGELKKEIEESNFGGIENLSSIQLYEDENLLTYWKGIDKFSENLSYTSKGDKKLVKYDPKSYEGKFIKRINDKNKELTESDIFVESVEIGIKRESENKGFFKKQRYKLKTNKFYFGFYLSLREDIKLKNGIIQLGDKHSLFSFEVIKKEKQEEKSKLNLLKENYILFLGEAYLNKEDLDEILKISEGSLVDNKKFKFIVRKENKYTEDKKLKNLISRGSIFLLDKDEKMLKILNDEKYKNYKKIGLNNFDVIKGGN